MGDSPTYGWEDIDMEAQGRPCKLGVILLALLVCAAAGAPLRAAAGAVSCDWQPGDPYKMHWPQLPDLSFTGIDISLAQGTLADDFKCTATGPIRDIHIWGSFRDDVLPQDGPGALTLELSIYSDVPAQANAWSRPGTLLWQRVFKPGEYAAARVHHGPEDWYDPAANQYLPGNHQQAFQYDFCIDADPFTQKEGTIYWLAVRDLHTATGYTFGWKTTSPRYRWNDDAVFGRSASTSAGWTEMTYPKQHSLEGETLDLAFVITGDEENAVDADLGDAPDSSNSVAGAVMSTYPGNVTANFPTVYLAGSPPYGPLHLRPRDMFFLGKWVSLEKEADIGPDEDVVNNLDPVGNIANQDSVDDGLELPIAMPSCQDTTLNYTVTVTAAAPVPAYVNVWCDWNRDGDWDDELVCPDGSVVPEWVVQNDMPLLPGPGTYMFTSPPFRSWHPAGGETDPLWLRITIAEQPWQPIVAGPAVGGAGPAGGYEYGETEDYYIEPREQPTPAKYDWGDAPDSEEAPGYPTLAVHNGARHIPVGPWLGDAADAPDSEADGQPDLHALGDDMNGSDDENGVSIPTLVQGQPAVATVEVNGGGGVLQAWIDFDADQVWESTEKIFDGFLPDGTHLLPFAVPATAMPGRTFARFRISTTGGLDPNGPARDGEVEDHIVSIETPEKNEKWCQLPDLTPRGIDIRVDNSDDKNNRRALADDFVCRSTTKLVHIRFWGSWRDDHKGTINWIRVRIHPDDPIGPGGSDQNNKYSMPGPEILWEKVFSPGQFTEALYHVVHLGGEWWWDPATGKSTPGGDTQVWQIDMDIDPAQAFVQEGTPTNPRIYWLDIDVDDAEGEFGWKTRRWPEHFMDDAVWDVGPFLPRTWDELRYPPGHRYADQPQNSVDLSFCLLFAPYTPPPVTVLPGAVTQCPAVATTCPAVLTTCPPVQTRCPPVPTRCPPVLTRCPPTPTQCQPGETQCPPVETRCPPANTKCPPVQTRCPPVFTRCPPTETQCQTVQTRCPALFTRCPPVETFCPSAETKCPPLETECPPAETKCPVTQTRCPPALTKCPLTATECVILETQCPAVETRCPPVETKCPVTQTRCPPALTKCPPTATECVILETQCPAVETRCPAVETKCPETQTRCPPALTKCPLTATECIILETQCPAVETKCPPVETKCPPTATLCQVIETECPAVETRCPPVTTQCPVALTKCPLTATLCLTIETQCPVVETQCPPARTECPPVLTECPPVTTRCPAVLTQCPPTATLCQTIETECPAVSTQCPPVLTQCPPTLTLCTGTSCVPGTLGANAAESTVAGTPCPVTETACLTVADYRMLAAGG
jgi:hypothetical protein